MKVIRYGKKIRKLLRCQMCESEMEAMPDELKPTSQVNKNGSVMMGWTCPVCGVDVYTSDDSIPIVMER
jgi:hypothetical protein